mmetsp:Transcript_33509/g.49012  ORF Transcript_33509/g.49012 Transcript_33509/m.49012 type:complete len:228 (-) Transcript_33509:1323-2006(-)
MRRAASALPSTWSQNSDVCSCRVCSFSLSACPSCSLVISFFWSEEENTISSSDSVAAVCSLSLAYVCSSWSCVSTSLISLSCVFMCACMRSISTYMSAAAFCARLFCVLSSCSRLAMRVCVSSTSHRRASDTADRRAISLVKASCFDSCSAFSTSEAKGLRGALPSFTLAPAPTSPTLGAIGVGAWLRLTRGDDFVLITIPPSLSLLGMKSCSTGKASSCCMPCPVT